MTKLILIMIFYFITILPIYAVEDTQIDPDKIIPNGLLKIALNYFHSHERRITNKRFMGIIDYRQHSSNERFYIIDLESGRVEKYLVAHGQQSDRNNDGYATDFSNTIDSKMSSLGYFLTAETYFGAHGYSLRLDGQSATNSNARERNIVIHPADYVAPGNKIGRSFGCPALEPRYNQMIIDQIREGALIFASY